MKNTLFFGTQITASHQEQLIENPVEEIIALIKGEKGNLREEIRRLHNIKRLDIQAYKRAKTILPFICGSEFKGHLRKKENFNAIYSFILDFDNCAQQLQDLIEIKHSLCEREDVWFCYISPSGKGLKVAFKLHYPITDPAQYADFYKGFAASLAKKHQLTTSLDMQCHDVGRVSFLSYDPDIYFNPNAIPVMPDKFALSLFETENNTETIETLPIPTSKEPENYKEILQILNPKYHNAMTKPAPYVPDILEAIIPIVKDAVASYEIKVAGIDPIQYGLKFRFMHGLRMGEINMFYGKKGFSVVISPKRDTHPALNDLVHKIIYTEIHSINEATKAIADAFTREQQGRKAF